jgi:hypothetical protein
VDIKRLSTYAVTNQDIWFRSLCLASTRKLVFRYKYAQLNYKNSLIIASKVPGAWLVQIKDAGHAIMDQYLYEVGHIVNTFPSTITLNN